MNIEEYKGIFNGLPENGKLIYNSVIINETILNLLPENWIKEINK